MFVNNSAGNVFGIAIGAGDTARLSVSLSIFSFNGPSQGCTNCFPGIVTLDANAQGEMQS